MFAHRGLHHGADRSRCPGAGEIFGGAGVLHQVRSAAAAVQPGRKDEALDERYFGLHHDLPPETIAARLGGTLVWKEQDQGMWIALIRFNRQVEARNGEAASRSKLVPGAGS